jgi:hypothetical protein
MPFSQLLPGEGAWADSVGAIALHLLTTIHHAPDANIDGV